MWIKLRIKTFQSYNGLSPVFIHYRWLQPTELKQNNKIGFSQTERMSFVRIWVHLVFTTKNRKPWLTREIRYKIHQHIAENCEKKEIFLQAINGYHDHMHCLISLGKEQSIAQVAMLIKGESSFWINKNNLVSDKFMWADDYYANSVSDSNVETVIEYIKNQETHHSKQSFEEEVKQLLKICGRQFKKETVLENA